jgi:hypothetical protein
MDILRDYWAMLLSSLGFLVWLVRLEARTFSNEAELKRQREQRHEDMAAAVAARQETNKMLEEIRADIKTLMQKGGR